MRVFYSDEAPIDTLLQIAAGPVWDGDLVAKDCRDEFVKRGWVSRCEGYNIITDQGRAVVRALKLRREFSRHQIENLKAAFVEHDIAWPQH